MNNLLEQNIFDVKGKVLICGTVIIKGFGKTIHYEDKLK